MKKYIIKKKVSESALTSKWTSFNGVKTILRALLKDENIGGKEAYEFLNHFGLYNRNASKTNYTGFSQYSVDEIKFIIQSKRNEVERIINKARGIQLPPREEIDFDKKFINIPPFKYEPKEPSAMDIESRKCLLADDVWYENESMNEGFFDWLRQKQVDKFDKNFPYPQKRPYENSLDADDSSKEIIVAFAKIAKKLLPYLDDVEIGLSREKNYPYPDIEILDTNYFGENNTVDFNSINSYYGAKNSHKCREEFRKNNKDGKSFNDFYKEYMKKNISPLNDELANNKRSIVFHAAIKNGSSLEKYLIDDNKRLSNISAFTGLITGKEIDNMAELICSLNVGVEIIPGAIRYSSNYNHCKAIQNVRLDKLKSNFKKDIFKLEGNEHIMIELNPKKDMGKLRKLKNFMSSKFGIEF